MTLLDTKSAMYIPEALKHADYELFSNLNDKWHTPFFDGLIPFLRESYLWLPFYFFLILFTTINFKSKGWYWVLFFLINVTLSDVISSRLIKEFFFRLRPCQDPAFEGKVRLLVSYCPYSSSFTSSHAVNHFAAAMFIFTTFRKSISPFWAFVFLWACLISYAQVYVGVHFPLDVICGAIIGLMIGYINAKIFNKKVGLPVRL
ncbi:MAG: phosphatase PAP2 family protein [Ginsengibacter sp.]